MLPVSKQKIGEISKLALVIRRGVEVKLCLLYFGGAVCWYESRVTAEAGLS